jgi:hypothetical protein
MNLQSLKELSRLLGGVYEPVMIDGNGEASVALLIRKSLPINVEVESHRAQKHWYMGASVPLFNRDLLIVHLSLPGSMKPFLTLGTSHFKAQKSNFRGDPLFKIKRDEQERGALAILDKAGAERNSSARMLIGDMNTDVRLSSEMRLLKGAGYREALDVLDIPMGRRSSHSYFTREAPPNYWQTDAAYVSSEIQFRNALLSGYIAPDRSITDRPLEQSKTVEELRTRGSDHRMIIVELDVLKLR